MGVCASNHLGGGKGKGGSKGGGEHEKGITPTLLVRFMKIYFENLCFSLTMDSRI